jgi:hypothetical protein
MSNSWDIPNRPTKGDDEVDATYAGVGRVISQWEMIEVELSQIYAWLVKRPEEIEAVRLYSEGKRIFEERIKGLFLVRIPLKIAVVCDKQNRRRTSCAS